MKPITTCIVAGLQYLIHPQKLGSIQETINSDAIIPITLLTTDEVFGDVEGILQLFDSYDDVFTPDFGSILVEKPGGNGSHGASVTAREVYHLDLVMALEDLAELPSGPYFLHGPNLHQAWRLYDDDLGAFTSGVIPDDLAQPDEFQPLTSSSFQRDSNSIPVPSRLYHPRPSPRKPLSGIRVSISDTIALKGTYTTFSSRAWKSLYKYASTVTSEYARELLDLGAVIVGKTKTSQFGTGAEWVDEQAPWSARGDGYGGLKGGSVGAAAALSGYEWLQYSIGVDDAKAVPDKGIYSISPSIGNMSNGGMITTSRFDRPRLFSRNLEGLLGLAAKSLGVETREFKFPTKILFPADLVSADETQRTALDAFVSSLQDFLGVQLQRVDVGGTWAQYPPIEADNEDMQTYMRLVGLTAVDIETELTRVGTFSLMVNPFIEATPQFFWNQCKSITELEHREDIRRLEIYRKWFHEHIMRITSAPKAQNDALLILPCGHSVETEHRDEAVAHWPVRVPDGREVPAQERQTPPGPHVFNSASKPTGRALDRPKDYINRSLAPNITPPNAERSATAASVSCLDDKVGVARSPRRESLELPHTKYRVKSFSPRESAPLQGDYPSV
ncbi:hypothetical protein FZEAL_4974 [Fusarium zealandicum]|uniref:Amidase domain-containing protein n=1 Tax=Fusarium zealandicum TaxID=1053134 RepID=A0A8H4ULE5_9HYPO|nr:hypothetical protein FZEAL_4974 [Fusarium zealandicum]